MIVITLSLLIQRNNQQKYKFASMNVLDDTLQNNLTQKSFEELSAEKRFTFYSKLLIEEKLDFFAFIEYPEGQVVSFLEQYQNAYKACVKFMFAMRDLTENIEAFYFFFSGKKNQMEKLKEALNNTLMFKYFCSDEGDDQIWIKKQAGYMKDLKTRLEAIDETFINKFTDEKDRNILTIIKKMDEITKEQIEIQKEGCINQNYCQTYQIIYQKYTGTIKLDSPVSLNKDNILQGMRYKLHFYSKIKKGTGNHGILFGYDTNKFKLIEQRGITFKSLGSSKISLHSQLATIYVLLDESDKKKQNVLVVAVLHFKSKGGDIERADEILDLMITLNRDYADRDVIIMGDFNGEKNTFEDFITNENILESYKNNIFNILKENNKDQQNKVAIGEIKTDLEGKIKPLKEIIKIKTQVLDDYKKLQNITKEQKQQQKVDEDEQKKNKDQLEKYEKWLSVANIIIKINQLLSENSSYKNVNLVGQSIELANKMLISTFKGRVSNDDKKKEVSFEYVNRQIDHGFIPKNYTLISQRTFKECQVEFTYAKIYQCINGNKDKEINQIDCSNPDLDKITQNVMTKLREINKFLIQYFLVKQIGVLYTVQGIFQQFQNLTQKEKQTFKTIEDFNKLFASIYNKQQKDKKLDDSFQDKKILQNYVNDFSYMFALKFAFIYQNEKETTILNEWLENKESVLLKDGFIQQGLPYYESDKAICPSDHLPIFFEIEKKEEKKIVQKDINDQVTNLQNFLSLFNSPEKNRLI